jgi:hypothetical protein
MNALEALKSTLVAEEPLGVEADAWFTALDHRMVEVGTVTCIATVLGIHTGPAGLWIQLSCADDWDLTAVVFVDEHTRIVDVLQKLRDEPPVGAPLEIIDCSSRAHNALSHQLRTLGRGYFDRRGH